LCHKSCFFDFIRCSCGTGLCKVKKDNNNNYAIKVHLFNLAEVKRLQPSKHTYVVWLVSEQEITSNIGQVNSSTSLFSKKLSGYFETVSSFKPAKYLLQPKMMRVLSLRVIWLFYQLTDFRINHLTKVRTNISKEEKKSRSALVIVAHPDDETLWAGGTILSHPSWKCFIISLCRGSDKERALKFYKALKVLKSEGCMGDIDDGPEQNPLEVKEVERTILDLLPSKNFDFIISHNPTGEYTKHTRHQEVSKAVIKLWVSGKIYANELWTFAYEDGNKKYYPKPVENATIYRKLTKRIWKRKYSIITEIYDFKKIVGKQKPLQRKKLSGNLMILTMQKNGLIMEVY